MFNFAVFRDAIRPHLYSTLGTSSHDDVARSRRTLFNQRSSGLRLSVDHPHVTAEELLHHVVATLLTLHVPLHDLVLLVLLGGHRVVAHPVRVVHLMAHHLHVLHVRTIHHVSQGWILSKFTRMSISQMSLKV